MNALDRLAPYPRSDKQTTAERLSTALTARAYLLYCQLPDRPEGSVEAAAVSFAYGVVTLLGRIAKTEGVEVADGLARNLWWEFKDIEGMWFEFADTLKAAGIDPDRIAEIAAQAGTETAA